MIPPVVLAVMVPGAVMLGLITIDGTGIQTSRVLHASDVVTPHQIVICLLWLYFLRSITSQ